MPRPAPRPQMEPNAALALIWSMMAGMPLLWLAVAAFARWRKPGAFVQPGLRPLVWVALALAIAGCVASMVMARRRAPSDPVQAMRRMTARLALCEAGVIVAAFAWLYTGDASAWIAAGVGVLGTILGYPPRVASEWNPPSPTMR